MKNTNVLTAPLKFESSHQSKVNYIQPSTEKKKTENIKPHISIKYKITKIMIQQDHTELCHSKDKNHQKMI